jgi:S1/P1 Nuclease
MIPCTHMRLAVLGLLAGSVPAFAWGPEGHSLVARIAEANLTAEARAQIAALLGPGETLHGLASWADEVRRSRPETEPWHYIDIPISRPALDMARDCAAKGCVITAIEEFRKVLADKNASQAKRREALLFVVHFVGDMHQPLHCSDDGDKGGNQVSVRFYGNQTNLHRVWDSGLLGRMAPEDELYAKLSKAVTAETLRQWSRGTVEDWAEEGHQIAKQTVYGRLPGVPKTEPAQLGEAYERAAQPVVEQQIEKAGARLAFVLNTALM